MADVRHSISRSVPGRIDAGRSSLSEALVARCRCMSYGICLAWTTCIGFGFRPTWLGPIWQVFRSVRFPDLAGFRSRQMLEAGARGSRFTLHVRIPRCVCVTDFDDGLGCTIGLRALRPAMASRIARIMTDGRSSCAMTDRRTIRRERSWKHVRNSGRGSASSSSAQAAPSAWETSGGSPRSPCWLLPLR